MIASTSSSNRKFLWLIIFVLALSTALTGQHRVQRDTLIKIEAQPDQGFNYPYLLFLSAGTELEATHFLIVEPNNSGNGSDDFSVHENQARMQATKGALGSHFSKTFRIPLLMPIFPRPEKDWHLYTQALDRDVMLLGEGKLKRLDLQLVNMIHHGREKLQELQFPTEEQVLMIGYSASGVFTNRFAMMHPKLIRAVVSGGVNGLPILPLKELKGKPLIYPIGISDFEAILSQPFDLSNYLKLEQMIYMGAEDTNDAIQFDDGFSQEERDIIYEVVGKEMLKERWLKCQEVFSQFDSKTIFKTYLGIGHNIDQRILNDIEALYRRAMK